MSKIIFSIIEVMLVLYFIFSAFEIINLSALHRDRVSIGYTCLQIKKDSTPAEYARIAKIEKEINRNIRFFKISAIISGILIIIVPLISLIFPSIRKFIFK